MSEKKPPRVSDAVFEAILEDVRAGGRVREVFKKHKTHARYFYADLADQSRAAAYSDAINAGLVKSFDELLDVADGEPAKGKGVDSLVRIGRDRLRVDTRKWALQKRCPKVYGERHVIAGDPDAPLSLEHVATVRSRLLSDPAEDPAPGAPGETDGD